MLPHNTERDRQPATAAGAQTQGRNPMESEREALSAIFGNLRRALMRGMMSDSFRNASKLQTAFGLTPLAAIPLVDLIGSSPLLPVADPRFLVNQVDGVALIASEQTSRSAVKAALQETPGIEAKILGAAMNRVQDDFARNYPEYGSFHKVA